MAHALVVVVLVSLGWDGEWAVMRMIGLTLLLSRWQDTSLLLTCLNLVSGHLALLCLTSKLDGGLEKKCFMELDLLPWSRNYGSPYLRMAPRGFCILCSMSLSPLLTCGLIGIYLTCFMLYVLSSILHSCLSHVMLAFVHALVADPLFMLACVFCHVYLTMLVLYILLD